MVSGDYKVENDGLSTPFEPVKCHEFASECTFGLPIYKWESQAEIFNQVNAWWRENVVNCRRFLDLKRWDKGFQSGLKNRKIEKLKN